MKTLSACTVHVRLGTDEEEQLTMMCSSLYPTPYGMVQNAALSIHDLDQRGYPEAELPLLTKEVVLYMVRGTVLLCHGVPG